MEGNISEWYKMDKGIPEDLTFPKLRFKNVKEVNLVREFGPPPDRDFFWAKSPHALYYNERLIITAYCPFDFSHFPFDSHHCSLNFGLSSSSFHEYNLSYSTIYFEESFTNLGDKGISISSSQFDLILTSVNPYLEIDGGFRGYPFVGMNMEIRRKHLGLLVGGYFVPCLTFSVISLVSYAIKSQNVPGRLGMLVTLYLIMANVYNSAEGPKSRGFSYIEVWFLGMQTPILIGIFEYAALLAKKKYSPNKKVVRQVKPKGHAGNTISDLDKFENNIDKWTFMGCLIFIILFTISFSLITFLI